MDQVVALTNSYFEFVNGLDPRLLDVEAAWEKIKEQCQALLDAFYEALERLSETLEQHQLSKFLQTAKESINNLEGFQQALTESCTNSKAIIEDYHQQLSRSFSDWVKRMESYSETGKEYYYRWKSLAPTNYYRNIFHISNSIIGVSLYHFFLDRIGCLWVLTPLVLTFLMLEVIRRISPAFNRRLTSVWPLKLMIRPRELHQVPAATYYAIGLWLSLFFCPKVAVELGVLVLGFGDPAASLIGKRLKTRKLFGEKSLGGSLGFLGVGFLISSLFLITFYGSLFSLSAVIFLAFIAALTGMLGELFARKLDDNFTIIMAASFSCWIAIALFL